ncbi:hypothetical protein N8I77_005902 [Diaporthe amygdali]|uniref:ZN622/Rei1/Reh1 zinc finger C2H2-type domain-containing protein n=1 Tax=Phomopsis amygdali TaxID=1214568 RepID=A0AAD9SGM5_PHOAM|nr:hypothetical protein N8I77_005902 [Diaporthe amygdali]
MNLLSSPGTSSNPTSFQESIDSPDKAMPQFTPGQCLFCPNPSTSFDESVSHMRKSHGLFIPHQQHLAVDLETLFRYLHLVIFGYRECLQCGTERATVQAVQQHMTGKGHCRFDTSEEGSEFAEFYDFSEPEDVAGSESEGDGEGDESSQKETVTSPSRKPQPVDQDSIRLPSGRIISRQSSAQVAPSFTQLRRRTRTYASRLEYSLVDPEDDEGSSSKEPGSDVPETRVLSKREKREKEIVTNRLTSMSANDRNSLIHLPASQQRSIIAAQLRHAGKVQKEERRRQGKIDRKGNKNLYAYWHTETPVYQCG